MAKALKCDICGELGTENDIFALRGKHYYNICTPNGQIISSSYLDVCDCCYVKFLNTFKLDDKKFQEADEKLAMNQKTVKVHLKGKK